MRGAHVSYLYSSREPIITVRVRSDPRVHWTHKYSGITACGINKLYADVPNEHSYKRVDEVPTCLVCVSRIE